MRSLSNYYPYGMQIEAGSWSGGDYNYGYNGMLKEGIGKDIYHTLNRALFTEVPVWMKTDPLENMFPWRSPYVSMGNNPISFIDPFGDKEYESEEAYKKETGNNWSKSGKGDWLNSDRENNSPRWNSANFYNLQALKPDEYVSIEQRTDFYIWFDGEIKTLGFETQWAAAAAKIANVVDILDEGIIEKSIGSEELSLFANKGNKMIFDDALPKLKKLINSTPLKGNDALNWDIKTLWEEQILVQPLYMELSNRDYNALNFIVKSDAFLLKPISSTNIALSYLSNQSLKKAIFGISPYPLNYQLNNVSHRWLYGMENMGYKQNNQIKKIW